MRYVLLFLSVTSMFLRAADIPLELKHWNIKAESEQIVQPDSTVTFQSMPSLRIKQEQYQSTVLTQSFQVQPNQCYRLTADVKLNNPYLFGPGYSGFVIQVIAGGKNYGGLEPLTAVRDWSKASFVFNSGNNSEMTLQIYTYKSRGTVWIGRLQFTPVSDPRELGDVTPPDLTLLSPDDEEKEKGYIVFRSHPQEQCYSTRRPRKDERGALKIAAARGEYEAAVLGVFALKNLNSLQVKLCGDLVNAAGARIPAGHIEIRTAVPYQFKLDHLRYVDLPFLLERKSMMNLAGDRSLRYFFTVKIPEDALAGTYKGKIQIQAANAGMTEVELAVQVYPFSLELPGKAYFFYHNRTAEYRIYADMAQHGMNTVTLYDNAKLKQGGLQTALPQTLKWMRGAGLLHSGIPLIYLYMNRQDWLGDFTPPPQVIRQLLSLAEKEQIRPPLFYCLDEPMETKIPEAVNLIRKIKQAVPEVQMVSALDKTGLDHGLLEVYDTIILTNMNLSRETQTYIKQHPEKCWYLYDCFQNGKNPLVDRYMYGVYLFASGAGGFGQWVYCDPKRRQESRLLITYGYVCPAADDLVPTLGWEAKREGIDDMRYIATLKYHLQQVQKSQDPTAKKLLERGNALLATIRESIELDSFKKRLLLQTGTEYRRDNQPQKNWPLERMDQWRTQMAQLIMELQKIPKE